MANLTLKIEDDVLKRARIHAIEDGTSVNEIVRKYLEAYAVTRADRIRAMKRLLELADRLKGGSGGRKTPREELYDR